MVVSGMMAAKCLLSREMAEVGKVGIGGQE